MNPKREEGEKGVLSFTGARIKCLFYVKYSCFGLISCLWFRFDVTKRKKVVFVKGNCFNCLFKSACVAFDIGLYICLFEIRYIEVIYLGNNLINGEILRPRQCCLTLPTAP